jgi:hypothetical protein
MKALLTFLPLLLLTGILSAQPLYSDRDRQIWQLHTDELKKDNSFPLAQRTAVIAKSFLGTPYKAHTLEVSSDEQLIINLREFDCTTFIESTLAFAFQSPDTALANFCRKLQLLRYRRGEIDGYASRLHYLSDWLYDNQRKGLITILTEQLGGVPYDKSLRFMTTHRSAYRQLTNPTVFEEVSQVEDTLARRKLLYIPKTAVKGVEKQLRDGDLIAITTSIQGLDAVHVGFAIWQNGQVHLLHASSDEGHVVVSAKPLAEYLAGNKSQTGIMVARVKEK